MPYKNIWCKLENGYYVLIRTRPAQTADRIAAELNDLEELGRTYVALDEEINPNL